MRTLVILLLFLGGTSLWAYSADHFYASKLGLAITSARKEFNAWEGKHGAGHKKVIEVRHNLAKILVAAGRFVEASHHGSNALFQAENTLGANHYLLGEILTTVAKIELGLGRLQPAEAACQRALLVIKKTKKGQGQRAAALLGAMAQVRIGQCRFGEAEKLAKQALAFRKRAKKHKALFLCEAKCIKARALVGLGRFQEAEKLCQEILKEAKASIGEDHFFLAPVFGTMCLIRVQLERYRDVYPLFKKQRDILEKSLGKVSPTILLAWDSVIEGAARLSAYRDARRLVGEGEAIVLKNCSAGSPIYCRLLLAKGLLELFLDEPQKSANTASSLRNSVSALGNEHPLVARSRTYKEKLALTRGEARPKALQTFKWALQVIAKTNGNNHPNYGRGLYDLASVFYQQGKVNEAKDSLIKAKKLIAATVGRGAPTIARIMSREAQILIDAKEYTAAEKTIKRAVLISQKALGKSAFYTLSLRSMLSTVHKARGLKSDCANELEAIIHISEKLLGPRHAVVLRYKLALATAWLDLGLNKRAKQLLKATIPLARHRFGINHPLVGQAEHIYKSMSSRRRKK